MASILVGIVAYDPNTGAWFAFVLGENLPPAVLLVFGLFGIGWILVGYARTRPSARSA